MPDLGIGLVNQASLTTMRVRWSVRSKVVLDQGAPRRSPFRRAWLAALVTAATTAGCSSASDDSGDRSGWSGSGGTVAATGGAGAASTGAGAGSGGRESGGGTTSAGGDVGAANGGGGHAGAASSGAAPGLGGGAGAATSGGTTNPGGDAGLGSVAGAAGAGSSPGGTGAEGGSAAASGGATAGSGGATGAAGNPSDEVGVEVAVDPYGNCPLVAVVNLTGLEASEVQAVQVIVTGQDGGPDLLRTYAVEDDRTVIQLDTSDVVFAEPGLHVPVLGLYPDRDNGVRIHVDRRDGGSIDRTVTITTRLSNPDEPAWVPGIQVNTAVTELMEPGWTVAEISIEPNPNPPIVFVDWTRSIAFDERGAIRWALRLELPLGETFTLRRSIDGNFLSGSFDTLVEVTRLGRIRRSFQLPDHTLNHEIVQIGSDDNGEGGPAELESEHRGNVLVLASRNGASTIQDRIVEVDSGLGAVLGEWDLTEVLDPGRTTFIDPDDWPAGSADWLHANGLAYSKADEAIIVSGRHQGGAKLRRDATLVWLLAPHEGWNEPQSRRLLTAVNADGAPYDEPVQLGREAAGDPAAPEFDWPFGQHSPVLLPNGDLLLFDNGCSRHFRSPYGSYSRAVIYRIDEAAMTVRQIAQHVLSRSESAFFVSNTYRLPTTGNVLIQPGGSAQDPAIVKELTTRVAEDGTLAFDTVVFDAQLDLSFVDASRWYVYSYRGHRWTF